MGAKEFAEEFERIEAENKRLKLELEAEKKKNETLLNISKSRYLFPSEQVVPFELIAELTNENPEIFKEEFLTDPSGFLHTYMKDFYLETSNNMSALKIAGLSADGKTSHPIVNEIIAFKNKHPVPDLTEEFVKDYPRFITNVDKYIDNESKLTNVRVNIVRRSAGMLSMFAYWLHIKFREYKIPDLIISEDIQARLESAPQQEEGIEEPEDDHSNPFAGITEKEPPEPKEPKNEGIIGKAKELGKKAGEFFTKNPLQEEEESEEDDGEEEHNDEPPPEEPFKGDEK